MFQNLINNYASITTAEKQKQKEEEEEIRQSFVTQSVNGT